MTLSKHSLCMVVALVEFSATSSNASPYSAAVLVDNPVSYWRLGDSGSPGVDEVGGRNLGYQGTPLPGQSGAIAGDPNTATGFLGDRSALSISFEPALNTSQFSIESWVNIAGDCENTLECHQVFVASPAQLDCNTIIFPGSNHFFDSLHTPSRNMSGAKQGIIGIFHSNVFNCIFFHHKQKPLDNSFSNDF